MSKLAYRLNGKHFRIFFALPEVATSSNKHAKNAHIARVVSGTTTDLAILMHRGVLHFREFLQETDPRLDMFSRDSDKQVSYSVRSCAAFNMCAHTVLY